ncbi:MAG: hypothetical protein ABW169_13380 [Sphingobium sp.]
MSYVNSNAFMAYGDTLHRKEALTGPLTSRKEAKEAYAAIVRRIHAATNLRDLQDYLASIEPMIRQFEQELDYLWNGDGEDFAGLSEEMIRALEKFRGPIPGSRAAVANQEEGLGL